LSLRERPDFGPLAPAGKLDFILFTTGTTLFILFNTFLYFFILFILLRGKSIKPALRSKTARF